MLTVKDILPDYPLDNIMVRTNSPKCVEDNTGDGMLCGLLS